jgi:hypothetical protein
MSFFNNIGINLDPFNILPDNSGLDPLHLFQGKTQVIPHDFNSINPTFDFDFGGPPQTVFDPVANFKSIIGGNFITNPGSIDDAVHNTTNDFLGNLGDFVQHPLDPLGNLLGDVTDFFVGTSDKVTKQVGKSIQNVTGAKNAGIIGSQREFVQLPGQLASGVGTAFTQNPLFATAAIGSVGTAAIVAATGLVGVIIVAKVLL